MFLVVFVWNIQKKNVNNHFVYVFQASPKRLNSFEWVMCPLYAQPSIFTLAVFFYLGDLGKQEWKADTIPLCRFFFICPLAYLFWCYTLTSRVGDRSDSLLSWNCRRSAISGCQCVPFGVLAKVMRNYEWGELSLNCPLTLRKEYYCPVKLSFLTLKFYRTVLINNIQTPHQN